MYLRPACMVHRCRSSSLSLGRRVCCNISSGVFKSLELQGSIGGNVSWLTRAQTIWSFPQTNEHLFRCLVCSPHPKRTHDELFSLNIFAHQLEESRMMCIVHPPLGCAYVRASHTFFATLERPEEFVSREKRRHNPASANKIVWRCGTPCTVVHISGRWNDMFTYIFSFLLCCSVQEGRAFGKLRV